MVLDFIYDTINIVPSVPSFQLRSVKKNKDADDTCFDLLIGSGDIAREVKVLEARIEYVNSIDVLGSGQ